MRRQITLRNPSNFDGPARSSSESTILPLRRTYSQAGTFRTAVDNTVESWWEFWAWLHTPAAKGILKSSLAYLLGSMATFLPPIANFLGHQDSKHLVCTITVYFHPSRSQGSMQEAIILGLGAFFYAVFVSVSSMATSVFFESQLGMIELVRVEDLVLSKELLLARRLSLTQFQCRVISWFSLYSSEVVWVSLGGSNKDTMLLW